MEKKCGNCAHASQGGLSEHYRRWLVNCTVAGAEVKRAEKAMEAGEPFAMSVSGPHESSMGRWDDASTCPLWTARRPGDKGYL